MSSNLTTGFYLMLIGMGVVFSALLSLQGFINLVARIGRWSGRAQAIAPADASTEEKEGTLDEEVALCAAVVAVLDQPARIHHIRLLQDESQETWSRVGRLDIMRSHGRLGRPE